MTSLVSQRRDRLEGNEGVMMKEGFWVWKGLHVQIQGRASRYSLISRKLHAFEREFIWMGRMSDIPLMSSVPS